METRIKPPLTSVAQEFITKLRGHSLEIGEVGNLPLFSLYKW